MAIKVRDVNKWQCLKAGEGPYALPGGPRTVRIEVNAPTLARIDCMEAGRMTFLAAVQGMEVIEFAVQGDVELSVDSVDDVWFFTDVGDQIAVVNPGNTSFTNLMQRRERNPVLEEMMAKAQRNMEARLEAMVEARMQAFGHDPETGEVPDGEDSSAAVGSDTDDAEAAPDVVVEPPAEGKGKGA